MQQTSAAVDTTASPEQIDREGLTWWWKAIAPPSPICWDRSSTPISDKAFDMIVAFEVGDRAAYDATYRHGFWPGGHAGTTFGIGYDLGYTTSAHVALDWDEFLDGEWIHKLGSPLGIKGAPSAPALAKSLAAEGLDVPWENALDIHRRKVLPRWVGITERALANTAALSPGQLGALVSLVQSRGADFQSSGEMRAIGTHMREKAFAKIPGELRKMKRLYPEAPGLRDRREAEASLFEAG